MTGALLEQHAHVDGMTRVYLTLSAMAVATAAGGGGKARTAAAGEVRINSALQLATEKLAANPESLDAVARLGELQQAAARDESEAPALRDAVGAAVTGQFGAHISLLMHQERLDAPKGAALSSNGST